MGTSRQRLTKDVGATGLVETWGYIKDDFLKEWTGQVKIRSIDEMLRNSSAVGANRYLMEQMLRGVTWYINSEEGDDDPRVELLNDALNNMTHSFDDHIVDVVLMPFYGFSVFTITYEFVGGRTYWRKFKMLGHDTIQQWLIAEDGGIEGLQQWPHLWPAPIPIERMLLYRFRKPLNNPEGESILRPAWTSWYYVKNLQNIEAISLERMGAGLPVITPPEGADMGGADGDNAELVVRNIRQDQQAGVVLPPPNGEGDHNKWHLELLSAAGTSMSDFDNVISRYEKRILMTTLSQFLMLGQDNVGALATFEGGDDLFTRSINSLADNIAATFTQYAIPRLLKMNGIDDTDGVKLEHTPADSVDLDSIAVFLQQAGGFVTWTAEDEAMLRSVVGMPEKDIEQLAVMRGEVASGDGTVTSLTQQHVLNGAQITSAIAIIDGYNRGAYPRENALQMVQTFFNLPAMAAEAIVPTEPGTAASTPMPPIATVDENSVVYITDRHPEDEAVSRAERRTGRYMAAFLREQQKEVTGDLDA